MATVTPNFNWPVPTSTDLVKDGATAIEALGDSIDASLLDLKGGTTGQVLSKTSGTDMDFTWVTSDDANAIQNAIVDAKGDLIGATAADTPARLAVGANGTVLTADSAESTGLKWATPVAGGMTLINTGGTTLTGSSTTISSIPGTYKQLRLYIQDFSSASAPHMYVQFNSDTTATNYMQSVSRAVPSGSANFVANNESGIYTNGFTFAANAVDQFSVIDIYDYASSTTRKVATSLTVQTTGGDPTATTFAHLAYQSTTAITSLVIKLSTGTFTAGTALLYGVN
jgi:hypothetical protein